MDWLRIGAFGVLILYHIGMFFVPWPWHVKTDAFQDWLVYPMIASAPWRLPLLFLVSGFASRALLAKPGSTLRRFMAQRSWRLLLPLAFGIVLIIPPQSWVEAMANGTYTGSYVRFWFNQYFRFGELGGVFLPTYNHLWFVVYLFAYTAVLTILLAILPMSTRHFLQATFDRVAAHPLAVLTIPFVWLALARVIIWPEGGPGPQMLWGDWYRHTVYFPAFLFGFALASSHGVWTAIRATFKVALGIGTIAYCGVLFVLARDTGGLPENGITLGILQQAQAWGIVLGLLGVADRFLNQDAHWRNYLALGVFPFYIVHQTIIVLVGWTMLNAGANVALQFVAILTATLIGSWLFYELARRLGPLRPIAGLQ